MADRSRGIGRDKGFQSFTVLVQQVFIKHLYEPGARVGC